MDLIFGSLRRVFLRNYSISDSPPVHKFSIREREEQRNEGKMEEDWQSRPLDIETGEPTFRWDLYIYITTFLIID